jgi:hypothetical protein
MKFPLEAGTSLSRKILFDISEAGTENPDIFMNKLIQKVLEYKYQNVRPIIHFLMAVHLSFLICVLVFPSLELADKVMVTTYLSVFVFREII